MCAYGPPKLGHMYARLNGGAAAPSFPSGTGLLAPFVHNKQQYVTVTNGLRASLLQNQLIVRFIHLLVFSLLFFCFLPLFLQALVQAQIQTLVPVQALVGEHI